MCIFSHYQCNMFNAFSRGAVKTPVWIILNFNVAKKFCLDCFEAVIISIS